MSYYIDIIDTTSPLTQIVVENASASGIVLNWNGGDTKDETAIVSSELNFDMLTKTADDAAFINFFTGDEHRFKVMIKDSVDDAIIWQGYVLPDLYSEPYKNVCFFVSFTATDGLGRLKGKYLPEEYYSREKSLIDIYCQILKLTGIELDLYFFHQPKITSKNVCYFFARLCDLKKSNMKTLFWKLIFFSLVMTISIVDLFSQMPADSLGKYSYPAIAMNSNIAFTGTCFFIKKNSMLYLISAKHVFFNCDSLGKLNQSYPNQILIGHLKNIAQSFTVDTKLERGVTKCDGLDIYIKRINSSFSQYYNSVEGFIFPPIASPKTIEVFGYSSEVFRKDFVALPDSSLHSTIPEETFDFQISRDSLDKRDTSLMQIWCPRSVTVTHGFSGAPVFLQDKPTGKWRVIGVLQGGSPSNIDSRQILYYVDIKYVLEAIDKFK